MIHTPQPPTPRALSLDGWVSWELIDANTGRVERAGEQHNMFLNQGLDLLTQYGMGGIYNGYEMSGVAQYLAVGTGTADPEPTQTALGAEIARTGNCPVPFVFTRVSDGVYRRSITREFAEAEANGNLAEWGWSPSGSFNAALAVRERFRQPDNTPIILTKTSAQRLRMTYHLEFRLGPVVNTPAVFSVAGVGDLTGSYSLHRRSYSDNCDYDTVNAFLQGSSGVYGLNVGILRDRGPAPTYATVGGDSGSPPTYGTARQGGFTTPAYANGSFSRSIALTFGTTEGNVIHYGWTLAGSFQIISNTYYWQPGYTLQLDAGKEITTKDNLKKLTISGIALSWGRA